jgi:hypothetical protein
MVYMDVSKKAREKIHGFSFDTEGTFDYSSYLHPKLS